MKKVGKTIAVVLIITMIFTSFAFAHSGGLDRYGGHHDYNNVSGLGSYHYHCWGHPAHLHPYGVCPYNSNNSSYNSYSTSNHTVTNNVARLSSPHLVRATEYSNGIKVTWKKSRNAKNYNVYRSTSKNGTYKKIGSTSKLVYYDTSAKPSKTYYYKIKACNPKYKTSFYSGCASAKWHIERIKYKWVPSFVNGMDFSVGEVREIKVSYNEKRDITAYYDGDYVNVEWQDDSLLIYCENYGPAKTTIDLKYDDFGDIGSTSVDIYIEGDTRKVTDYLEFAGVPEFGSELGISPDFVDTVSGFRAYMYNFSTIENVGEKPLVYMYSYILELESRGFYLIEKTSIETGTYHLYTNGTRQVSVQNVEQGELKGIIVGVK